MIGRLLISLALVPSIFGSNARTLAAEPATKPGIEEKTRALAEKWKERFATERFNVVVSAPFVIAGDGTPAQLAGYRDGTVRAAARAMRAQFFTTPPDEPILILLFESAGPYERLSKAWFGADDLPHYGLYRHHDRTMLMNVSTGTGTLVHELAHALIVPDFPDVPDWFNEGLASLYEQSQFGPGGASIRGLPNWRLPGLQRALKDGTLRPLPEMIEDNDFRNPGRVGINYAQARYLMFYLQERKLLERYYADFRAARHEDPTGLMTLKKLIAPQSMDAFEKDWRAWVMTLDFGR